MLKMAPEQSADTQPEHIRTDGPVAQMVVVPSQQWPGV